MTFGEIQKGMGVDSAVMADLLRTLTEEGSVEKVREDGRIAFLLRKN
jgi:ribosomal protein S25